MADGKFLIGKPSGGVTTVTFKDGVSNTSLVLPESGTVASTDGATVDNTIPRYDGTTGKLQNSGVIVDDNNNIGVGTSNIFSTGGKTIHLYNNLNDGTANSNSTLYLESANRNSNIICKGSNAGFQGLDTSGNVAAQFGIDCINKNATVFTNGSEKMRIDTSGNVLVTGSGGLGYGAGAGGTVTQLTSKSTAVTLNKPSGRIITASDSLAAGTAVSFILNNSLLSTGDNLVVNNDTWGVYDTKCRVVTNGSAYIYITNNGDTQSQSIPIYFSVIRGATA